MKFSIEDIRQTQKGRGFWLRLSNEMATQLIYRIQNINVSPNLFTLFSLIFGLLFGLALVNNFTILSAILLNLLYLFDNLDGQWARIKKMTSKFGALFDSLVDGWNIVIVVLSMGIYLFNETQESYYLYITVLFFILSFLDFALEKNMIDESQKDDKPIETISLQKKSSRLRPIIKIIDTITLYDKWIFVITMGLLFGYLHLALIYIILVRSLNYGVKLLKLYMQFR